MRIVYILAGAGGMYCGACNRDMELVTGIQKKGYDIQLIPLYTPLRSDIEQPPKMSRIFYGGILTFLEQKIKMFRYTPRFIDALFDNKTLLNFLSKFTIETKPQKLGELTVSVLAGEEGNQKKELDRLIEFLGEVKPDIINITNSMLSGIAPSLKKHFAVPIVCTLQGEEAFIDALKEPFRSQAIELTKKNAQYIDMYVATHDEYKNEITNIFDIPSEKITIIPPGVNTTQYSFLSEIPPNEKIKIGYLSRIAPEKGLDILIEAFDKVQQKFPNVELHIAGQIYNKVFWDNINKRIKKDFDNIFYHGVLNLTQKKDFLKNCHIFCVPSRFKESRAMATLEAISSGIPVVVPSLGINTSIIENTRHGLLAESENAHDFALKIQTIIENQSLYKGENRNLFSDKYCATKMVDNVTKLYKELVERHK